MGCGLIGVKLWPKIIGEQTNATPDTAATPPTQCACQLRGALWAFAACAVVWVTLFTSFFTHPAGLVDSFKTFALYLDRGTGGEPLHLHEWNWYLKRLAFHQPIAGGPWFSEALILTLAIIGGVASLMRHNDDSIDPRFKNFCRFLTLYTLAMVIGYTLIPYKTPWCVLGWMHAMTWLAGLGALHVWRLLKNKPMQIAWAILLLAGASHLGWQTWRANFVLHTHRVNPYVYAHPSPKVREIRDRVLALAAYHPKGNALGVAVIDARNVWPLPFYLRQFERTGFYTQPPTADQWAALASTPISPGPEIVLANPDIALPELTARLAGAYEGPHFYGLRPDVILAMYVKKDLWQAWIATQ
jgi:predicted membrane-bound mannosyltransferase